jgi:hypothetical protein
MDEVKCEKCGAILEVGMFPFCSRRFPGTHEYGTSFRQRDEIPGGITLDNYGAEPVTFYSHSERRKWMADHGLHEKEKCTPFPGTDKDPMGIPRPEGYIDLQTMKNREILALRAAGCKTDEDTVDGVLVNPFSGTITERDAIAVANGDPHRSARLGRRAHGDRSG